MIQLRPYQEEVINKTREKMKQGFKSILITSPTGSGKTVLIASMLKSATMKGMNSLFVVHRRELIKQTTETFNSIGLNHGVISSGFNSSPKESCQIGSIQTIARRGLNFDPKLIVYDESHHCASRTWSDVYNKFTKSFHIGLTATPERLDGKGLSDYFKTIVYGPRVQDLIDIGYLSKYKIYSTPGINTNGVHTVAGDYSKSELETVSNKPSITGDVISHYKKLADGKKALISCVSIRHSKDVVSQFKSAGYNAAHLDGDVDMFERDETIRRFRNGDITILSNVDLFGEGFDLPSLEVAILLRPTKSLALYLQQVGRALRPSDGKKEAIIIDHAGNCQRHGLPCEERNWSLLGKAGRMRPETEPAISVRVCPSCFAAMLSTKIQCEYCGYKFETKEKNIKKEDGNLVEINKEMFKKSQRVEQGRTFGLSELIALGKQRGYKNPYFWAKQVFNSRQRKKLGGY